MNIEDLRTLALSYEDVEECTPFGDNILVYKVNGKIFLLFDMDDEVLSFNVKCDPDKAIELRAAFPFVSPGYHMNKKHWNTITIEGNVKEDFIREQVDHSYKLVNKGRKR